MKLQHLAREAERREEKPNKSIVPSAIGKEVIAPKKIYIFQNIYT